MTGASPDLPRSFQTLLDLSESEAKRTMSKTPGLVHLGIVLARKVPDAFDDSFGTGAAERLVQRANPGVPGLESGGDIRAFLDTAAKQASRREDLPKQLLDQCDAITELIATEPETPDVVAELHDSDRIDSPDASPADSGPGGDDSTRLKRTERYVSDAVPVEIPESRAPFIDEALSWIGRTQPRGCLVVGQSGSGKSTVGGLITSRLRQDGLTGPLASARVVQVAVDRLLFGNPSLLLEQLFEDASSLEEPMVIVLDDLEVLAGFGADNRVNTGVLVAIRAALATGKIHLIVTIDEKYVSRLSALDSELVDELGRVTISEIDRTTLSGIIEGVASRLTGHHGVTLPGDTRSLAMTPAREDSLRFHPGLAIDRLERACAVAGLRDDRIASPADLGIADCASTSTLDPSAIAARLGERIKGQGEAIERVARRLTLTRANLDLRPERPDGVFLFVGPTGVGKTALARAIAHETMGDENRLLRLDMSEYHTEWSISKLNGPPPGYVGSTDPDAWLTTRVRDRPDLVILLDEIEKAHPRVWNAFLQAFDAGRMTDSHGNIADFSDTIMIMTSNIGAQAFSTSAVGFRTGDAQAAEEERVMESVRGTLPPEFINRIDDIVVFQPLAIAQITEIARAEVDRIVGRLSARGYRLRVPSEVIEFLAEAGYDEAFGARHLHRNIERRLLEPLAVDHTAGKSEVELVAELGEDQICWRS